MTRTVVAALQIGSSGSGTGDTLQLIMSYEKAIIEAHIELLVMPEAILGGYPKGEGFGTYLGYRLPEGREAYARYFASAIRADGDEVKMLSALADRTRAHLVVGVIERSGGTLYCSTFFIAPDKGLIAAHRKLMPTGTERLIWGQGDGSTLSVLDLPFGRTGAVICWENHMPLLRMAMYAKGIEIWCAPTVDERDVWQCSMRHIAHEGRCFVISACQIMPSPDVSGRNIPGWEAHRPLIRGGSVIVGPLGEILAGPLLNSAGLVTAVVDMEDIIKARYDFDVAGHYSRPDIFELLVNEQARPGVRFINSDAE